MGKSSMTTVYMSFLATWARRLSWTETARVFASTWDNVRRAVEWVVEHGLEHRDKDFNHFWTYVSPTWAGKFLDRWCDMAMRSGIEPMKAKARMLRSHRELILNSFRAKKEYSSGVVEGLDTKVKLVTRKSFGFRKPETIKTALFHALGRLPEPEHAHRFG